MGQSYDESFFRKRFDPQLRHPKYRDALRQLFSNPLGFQDPNRMARIQPREFEFGSLVQARDRFAAPDHGLTAAQVSESMLKKRKQVEFENRFEDNKGFRTQVEEKYNDPDDVRFQRGVGGLFSDNPAFLKHLIERMRDPVFRERISSLSLQNRRKLLRNRFSKALPVYANDVSSLF